MSAHGVRTAVRSLRACDEATAAILELAFRDLPRGEVLRQEVDRIMANLEEMRRPYLDLLVRSMQDLIDEPINGST
jgi:hypothetical protein